MKRTTLTRSLLAAIALALAFSALPAMAQPGRGIPRGNCYLNGIVPGSAVPPTTALTDVEKAALNTAIDDEYKSRATYYNVLETFGDVMPFANIVNAEERHVEALAYLHERYDVAVPADSWAEKVPTYATLKEAAEAAIQGEKDNGALFDELKKGVNNAEVLNVFEALQFATMEHHLPAFQRLLDRENGQFNGRGYGYGRGNGMGRGRGGCGCCCFGAPVGNGPGRGNGLGAQTMRGRNWAPGQGRGLGVGRGNGLGRGQGYGLGYGRGTGRGFNPPPNCPWNN